MYLYVQCTLTKPKGAVQKLAPRKEGFKKNAGRAGENAKWRIGWWENLFNNKVLE